MISHSLWIYPHPMVWPLPRSETMVSIPGGCASLHQRTSISSSSPRIIGQTQKDPAFQGSARLSFSKFRALGSALSRVRQDAFAEKVKVRQENITVPWGSARSALSEFLAFRKIILLNLLWGVILRFLNHWKQIYVPWFLGFLQGSA